MTTTIVIPSPANCFITSRTSPTISGSSALGRLVKEHDFRLHAKRADYGDALLLPAGELFGIVLRLICKADALQEFHCLGLRLFLGFLQHVCRGERHVAQDGHVREEVEVLEHHAHLAAVQVYVCLWVGYINALEVDFAISRFFQEVERAQECALTAAGRADDGHNLAFFNIGGYASRALTFPPL